MIKLKDILNEISEEEYQKWKQSNEYKTWLQNWLKRYNAILDNKGRLEAYHATTHKKAKMIKTSGFRTGSYFSLNPEFSKSVVKTYHNLKDRGVILLKVHLPLDAIGIAAATIIAERPIKWEEVI